MLYQSSFISNTDLYAFTDAKISTPCSVIYRSVFSSLNIYYLDSKLFGYLVQRIDTGFFTTTFHWWYIYINYIPVLLQFEYVIMLYIKEMSYLPLTNLLSTYRESFLSYCNHFFKQKLLNLRILYVKLVRFYYNFRLFGYFYATF